MPSPISESEVDAVLSLLPEESWIRVYVAYAAAKVASHKLYHLGTGLTLLAACSSAGVTGSGPGFLADTYANFYCLIVGRSALAQKTMALNVGRGLLVEAVSEVVGADPASEEALYRSLASQRVQLIFYPEMGAWLANTSGADNYRAKLRDAYTGVFDGTSEPRITARGTIPMKDPRLSLLGACTPAHLEVGTRNIDWDGGFMSRFLICYAERERRRPTAPPFDMQQARKWLVDGLRAIATNAQPGQCLGLTEDAATGWEAWCDGMDMAIEHIVEPRVAASWSRAKLIGAKAGVLLTSASGRIQTARPWQVDAQHMAAACQVVNLHVRGLDALLPNIAPNEEGAELRRVLNAVAVEWGSIGEISRRLQMNLRKLAEYLGTLKEWGVVEAKPWDQTTFFRRITNGMPRRWVEGVDGIAGTPPPARQLEM